MRCTSNNNAVYLSKYPNSNFFLITHVMVILKKKNYLFLSIKKKEKINSEKGRIYYTICVDSRMVYKLDSGN